MAHHGETVSIYRTDGQSPVSRTARIEIEGGFRDDTEEDRRTSIGATIVLENDATRGVIADQIVIGSKIVIAGTTYKIDQPPQLTVGGWIVHLVRYWQIETTESGMRQNIG